MQMSVSTRVSTSMATSLPNPSPLPPTLKTYVAWRFDRVLPGAFRRNKAQFAHHEYPILAPLPTAARNTPALQRSRLGGPYLYFVCDAQERVRYVGKSKEDQVLQRWIRPGMGGPAKHYWTHSTAGGGCVFNIANGLQAGESSHYTLRYVPVAEVPAGLWEQLGTDPGVALEADARRAESAFIRALAPDWNRS